VRHDSSHLYASDDDMGNKKSARWRRPQLKAMTCIVGKPLQMHHFILRQTLYWAGSFAMFGLLSRSKTDCRRWWGFRVIFVGAHRNPQIVLKNVALSGFPTALEPTLRPLLPGTNASTVPSNRSASQPPLPRDDIPSPPPVVVMLGVYRLRLARIMWFLLPFVFTHRVLYGKAGETCFLVGSGSRS